MEVCIFSSNADRIEHLLRQTDRNFDLDPVTCGRMDEILLAYAVGSKPGGHHIHALGVGSNELIDLFCGEVCTIARMRWVAE